MLWHTVRGFHPHPTEDVGVGFCWAVWISQQKLSPRDDGAGREAHLLGGQ